MRKIADWVVENEKKESTDCAIPDEIIDEWLETIDERKKRMEKSEDTHTGQYEMLSDLEKKVQKIMQIRKEKCQVKSK